MQPRLGLKLAGHTAALVLSRWLLSVQKLSVPVGTKGSRDVSYTEDLLHSFRGCTQVVVCQESGTARTVHVAHLAPKHGGMRSEMSLCWLGPQLQQPWQMTGVAGHQLQCRCPAAGLPVGLV